MDLGLRGCLEHDLSHLKAQHVPRFQLLCHLLRREVAQRLEDLHEELAGRLPRRLEVPINDVTLVISRERPKASKISEKDSPR